MSFLKDFKDLKKDISVAVEEENGNAIPAEMPVETAPRANVSEPKTETASDVTVIAECEQIGNRLLSNIQETFPM